MALDSECRHCGESVSFNGQRWVDRIDDVCSHNPDPDRFHHTPTITGRVVKELREVFAGTA